ncbi:hypothetical protein OIV70_32595, partial [Burkholderia pseudomallei]
AAVREHERCCAPPDVFLASLFTRFMRAVAYRSRARRASRLVALKPRALPAAPSTSLALVYASDVYLQTCPATIRPEEAR